MLPGAAKRVRHWMTSTFNLGTKLGGETGDNIQQGLMSLRDGKLLWLRNPDRSVRALLQSDTATEAFLGYLEELGNDVSVKQLQHILAVRDMSLLPFDGQIVESERIYQERLAPRPPPAGPGASVPPKPAPMDPHHLPFELRRLAGVFIGVLAAHHLPGFLRYRGFLESARPLNQPMPPRHPHCSTAGPGLAPFWLRVFRVPHRGAVWQRGVGFSELP